MAGVPSSGGSGGAVRAQHVFTILAARTGARVISAYGRRGIPALARTVVAASGGWQRPVGVASTQLLPRAAMAVLRGPVTAALLDVHDHPGLQADGLRIPLTPAARKDLDRRFDRNVERFERLVVPSESFAGLCGLPADRVIVVTNGTDTAHVVPRPAPPDPVVGMVSGAAPGRGIELLLSAMSRVRTEIPEATLQLALTATGPASDRYLRALASQVRERDPWVTLNEVAYRRLSVFLGDAAVLVIPHPVGAYMDASTPVKLFDSMAAGRPLAVTPRVETRKIVEACRSGVVAASDGPDDLAEAILTLLRSEPLRAELGANARRCAVERYDWRVLSADLADAVLGS
ncbi:MAG: glycosyltransferase family 4 protein [Candidatus Limnocylindria bacterium]